MWFLGKVCNTLFSRFDSDPILSFTLLFTKMLSSVGIFITLLSLVTVVLAMVNHWNLSNAKLHLVYPLVIVNCILYIVVETWVALRDPEQIGLLLSDLTNLWGILMAGKGWFLLKEKEKEKEKLAKQKENK